MRPAPGHAGLPLRASPPHTRRDKRPGYLTTTVVK